MPNYFAMIFAIKYIRRTNFELTNKPSCIESASTTEFIPASCEWATVRATLNLHAFITIKKLAQYVL